MYFKVEVNNINTEGFHIRKEEISQIKTISRALIKYFTGIESITGAISPLCRYHGYPSPKWHALHVRFHGDIELLAKPLRKLLALPSFKAFRFLVENSRDMKLLVEAVGKGHEADFQKYSMELINGVWVGV
jgi:hypothetical protein